MVDKISKIKDKKEKDVGFSDDHTTSIEALIFCPIINCVVVSLCN